MLPASSTWAVKMSARRQHRMRTGGAACMRPVVATSVVRNEDVCCRGQLESRLFCPSPQLGAQHGKAVCPTKTDIEIGARRWWLEGNLAASGEVVAGPDEAWIGNRAGGAQLVVVQATDAFDHQGGWCRLSHMQVTGHP